MPRAGRTYGQAALEPLPSHPVRSPQGSKTHKSFVWKIISLQHWELLPWK